MLSILVLSKYSQSGASSRYRFYNYENWFIENNIKPTYKPLFNDRYIKYLYVGNDFLKNILAVWCIISRIIFLFKKLSHFDHIIIEAELFPKLPLALDQFFLKKMKSYSLDYDDNISANYLGTSLEGKIPSLIKNAKFVTVGNHWFFEAFEGNLIYLPTVIDLDNYPQHTNIQYAETIVWIGSPSTVKYLKIVEKALCKLLTEIKYTLKIIGGKIDLDSKINKQEIDWNPTKENEYLSLCSVGIMPLDNTLWEKGKCGFKLIQYMASGLPVIASNLPANREIIDHGVNGFIAETDDQWHLYLSLLLTDSKLAKDMGINARLKVENHYSYQRWGKKYANIIKDNM